MRDWQSVEEDLAAIWVNASDSQEATDAANLMDRLLANDPWKIGESREGNTRIVVVEPLAICCDVIVDDCRVLIWQLWRWGP